ncbi:NAD-dependent epimerase/dehydratase family protein [Fulvivirgaceae bacterium BMA10]|uniref:NAD-dependent epimerase/dehydratase family protein n=1 Tax=Splendidivirga corallicola TaxID=3051826 RepID=A0ABT8KUR4_9BACT|nr:NAD-dependent epimerase/dehydratase family protein [Fulvivirgaceae bacterium BMA10]
MIFTTGATGLVGSHICRRFLAEGHSIRALKRKNSDLTLIADIQEKIEWVEGDILDIRCLEHFLENVEMVIHAAAIISFVSSEKERMFQHNIEGTANIINTCLKLGISRFIHVSSIAALGRPVNGSLISEKTQWEESKFNTDYAKSKYLSEIEVWRGSAEGLNVTIVNPSIVLAPGDLNKSSTRIFKHVMDEKRLYTDGSLNYVDVRDVADAIFHLWDKNIQNERFILNAGSITYESFFKQIAVLLDKKPPTIKVSTSLLFLAVMIERIKSILTGNKPLLTRQTALGAKKVFKYSNDKIKSTLGFKFRPIQDTLEWSCKELLAKQNLS